LPRKHFQKSAIRSIFSKQRADRGITNAKEDNYWDLSMTYLGTHPESQESAVARDAMEEVGMTVRPIRKVWQKVSTRGTFILHWWLAEYVGGELALNQAEVSDARWLTVDEIYRLDGTFEGDREFYRQILPALACSIK
jgi:NADH pyrophosphatase NudC (nudix superfamily)